MTRQEHFSVILPDFTGNLIDMSPHVIDGGKSMSRFWYFTFVLRLMIILRNLINPRDLKVGIIKTFPSDFYISIKIIKSCVTFIATSKLLGIIKNLPRKYH